MKGKSKAETNNTDAKLKKRGSATEKVSKRQPKKQKKAAKDPNRPKRPPSAFFVFMEEFRQEFKRENPDNKSVSAVGKAAGARWKSMSDADKAPYVEKAEKRKSDYNKNMEAYNKKLEGTNVEEEEESDEKSRSEVHDDEEDEDETGEEEEDDD
ncbi:HMG1/2-like protein [Tripterygium wilfordii]|uniref:HMG1/2-like protein n=1 Tax=Tripterygium wilfordii TaxID=458696 RepID=UPI0018F85FD7|nr:HMG1/2-like protein [Tripterygium wilfordii]